MLRSLAGALDSRIHKLTGANEAAPYASYVDDPVGFMRDVRGFDPWDKQEQIARALVRDRRVLSYTCNGAGKSTLMAELILWFMSTRYNARVITTAGVGAQVRSLWRKVRASHQMSKRKLPGQPMTVQWEMNPEWYAIGISTEAEETMQGYHSWTSAPNRPQLPGDPGGLLACIDEASGVRPFVFNAMRGYMTTDNTYWFVAGNPNAPNTEFHEASKRGNWTRFQISAFDVPEHILSREWIEDQRRYWGEDSPQWQVRVLGQFPDVGGDFLVFPMSYFEATADIHPKQHDGKHMGVDIARGNADRNTIVVADDCRVVHAEAFHSGDLMEVVSKVEAIAARFGVPWENIHIDVIGLGAGVVDRLREKGKFVDGVDFGGKVLGDWPDLVGRDVKVLNRRAELYWAARQALNSDRASVPETYSRTIWREANLIQFEVATTGKLRIEAKDRIRDRFEGQSPDFADAWVLTFSRARNLPRIMIA